MSKLTIPSGVSRGIFLFFIRATLSLVLILATDTNSAKAGSGTWTGAYLWNRYSWEQEENWDTNTYPTTKDDVATFGAIGTTLIFVAAYTSGIAPGTMIFEPGASAYTFKPEYTGLTLTRDGIINNSGVTQTFQVELSSLNFEAHANAGSQTMISVDGSNGEVNFYDKSNAGEATIEAAKGRIGGGGKILFHDNSSADHATLIAGPADRTDSDAGYIFFNDRSQGGDAKVILSGGEPGKVPGQLEIYARASDSKDVTIGSLEGAGNVTLAQQYATYAANLVVGKNDVSTTFGGVIWYGYYFLNDGNLTKIGKGTLTLTGANLHRGGTFVKRGTLSVDNTTGSGTGTGPVTVEGGTLAGTGTIAGAVTVGTGAGRGATLAGGKPYGVFTPLTIQSSVLLNSDATLSCRLNSNSVGAGAVVAHGVTIKGAQFASSDTAAATLPVGTILTVLNDTASTLISGTFVNLPEGGTITVGNNTFQANYEGGDGNDLTLTVVP
jgi:autotransporter-associated beta strand protein